jgi:sn-glycerol 3-phosphate transport system substrate-binding protein
MKILILLTLLWVVPVQAKPIELLFWHGMAGNLGDEVRVLTEGFNHSQSEFVVKPVYKGSYLEILTTFAAAFRAHQAPDMVQIFEVGTALMLSPKGIVKPLSTLMQEQGVVLPSEDFIPSVRDFYSVKGRLVAMPFNLSTPVIYYNLDILTKVGYSPANFPKTWNDLEVLAQKINRAGYDCTYTTAYPGWILVESYMAIHGLPVLAENPLRVVFNTPELTHHFERLKRWHELHYFRYAGRTDDATILFTSSACPLLSQSSGAYNSLAALVPFKLGVASMPLDPGVSKTRHANVVGGAAIWAVYGQTNAHYKGIAQFFSFLARSDVQKRWHEQTGYLPLGFKGVYSALAQSSKHPNLSLARTDLQESPLTNSLNYLGPQNQIRVIADEVLEAMFAGLITPSQAMSEAVSRSNRILLRFSRNTQEQ